MTNRSRYIHRHQPGYGRAIKLTALWAVILLASTAAGIGIWVELDRPPDPVAACKAGETIAQSAVVIADVTDVMTEIQRRRLVATVRLARDGLKPGAKFTLLELNAKSPGEPTELISLCNPGRAADANALTTTTNRLDTVWRKEFADPIDQAFERLAEADDASASPIIRTIAAAVTRPDFDGRVVDRRLFVVSDMLEHDPDDGYSQIRGGDIWALFRQSPLSRSINLDLTGVDVEIDYLQRDAYQGIQGPSHRRFWRSLLLAARARQVGFIGLAEPRSVNIPDAIAGLDGDAVAVALDDAVRTDTATASDADRTVTVLRRAKATSKKPPAKPRVKIKRKKKRPKK